MTESNKPVDSSHSFIIVVEIVLFIYADILVEVDKGTAPDDVIDEGSPY